MQDASPTDVPPNFITWSGLFISRQSFIAVLLSDGQSSKRETARNRAIRIATRIPCTLLSAPTDTGMN
jgi:hypothetical protein